MSLAFFGGCMESPRATGHGQPGGDEHPSARGRELKGHPGAGLPLQPQVEAAVDHLKGGQVEYAAQELHRPVVLFVELQNTQTLQAVFGQVIQALAQKFGLRHKLDHLAQGLDAGPAGQGAQVLRPHLPGLRLRSASSPSVGR